MSSENDHNHVLCSLLLSENTTEKRLQMINKIVNFCCLLKLEACIFHFAVNYLDRTLCTFGPEQLEMMSLEDFRCLVASSTWLAFKFHGSDTVDDCSTIASVFEVSRKAIVETELDILRRLSCCLCSNTTYSILIDTLYEKRNELDQEMLHFAHQLSLLCILSTNMQLFSLQVQASAVLFLSLAYKRYYANDKETPSMTVHEEAIQAFPVYTKTQGTLALSNAISDLERMIVHVQTSEYYQVWRMRDGPTFSLLFSWNYVPYRELIYSGAGIATSPKKREHGSTVVLGCKEKKSPPKLKRCEAQ